MISEVGPDRVAGAFLGPLRTAALVAVLTGAAASVAFTLLAGHRNPSHYLIVLFVIWALPVHGSGVRHLHLKKLVGPCARCALWRNAVSLASFLGHLWMCCFRPTQGEDRLRVRCCSPILMAAHGHGHSSSRISRSQVLPSTWRLLDLLVCRKNLPLFRATTGLLPFLVLPIVPF